MNLAATTAINAIEEVKSPVGVFELPCGYLDPVTGELVREVEVREICGDEEDILASKSVPDTVKMRELVQGCLVRIGNITGKEPLRRAFRQLTLGDRTFLLFAARRATFGDDYVFPVVCPDCKHESTFRLNLAELEMKSPKDPSKRIYDAVLPSGRSVRYKVMTGEGEEQMQQLIKKNKDSALSIAILARLELLDGEPPTLKAVKRLGMRDRHFLRNKFGEAEGGIDTELEVECPNCGKDHKSQISMGREFFFPSEMPNT